VRGLKFKKLFFRNLVPQNILNKSLLFFGIICLFSILLSKDTYHSQKVFFNRYIFYAFAFWIGTASVFQDRKKILILTGVFIVSSLILAIGGLRDYLLLNATRLYTIYGRYIPFAMLPLFISYFIPFDFAVSFFAKNRINRALSLASLLFLVPCFFWQGARAAWVAIPVSILFVSIFKSKRFFGKTLVGLVLIFLLSSLFTANLWKKIETIPYPSQWSHRIPLFESAISMFKDSPVFGMGIGMYEKLIKTKKYALPEDYPDSNHDLYLHAHSLYFEIMAEMGIIGLFAFFIIFMVYFKNVFRQIKSLKDNDKFAVIIGISGLVVATLVSGVAGTIITVGVNETYMFWFLLGWACGLLPKQSDSCSIPERKQLNG
jgi:O-antigen ligase